MSYTPKLRESLERKSCNSAEAPSSKIRLAAKFMPGLRSAAAKSHEAHMSIDRSPERGPGGELILNRPSRRTTVG